MPTLHKVKTDSLRAQIYTQLKDQLLKGTWKEGEKLPSENELCETFGVSRVTVRAAIQQLEILGLVETRHGGGTRVRRLPVSELFGDMHAAVGADRNQDVMTVLEYRKVMEKGTIGLAVDKATPEDIEYLESTYNTIQENSDDALAVAKADHAFHLGIAEIARNPIIHRVYLLIDQILSTAMIDIIDLVGSGIALVYHRKLIDALKARDKRRCEDLMEEHINVIMDAVLEKGAVIRIRDSMQVQDEPVSY